MSKLLNETSIPILLKEMSPREKIDLLVGGSSFSSVAMPQYGIPSIRYMDGATGVNMMQYASELLGMFEMEEETEKSQVQGEESSNESGAAALGLMDYVTNELPLPDGLPKKMVQRIEKVRAAFRAIRPEGEEPGCFPPGMLLGATWNPEIVYKVGEAVAREAIAYGIDVLLGTPNTNLHRDPRNGRLFESFSEDPCLNRAMAPAFSKGVQDQGMAANVKHFAANNQETLRQGIDEHISERALREIYLPGFEAAVKDGGVATVMSAYNSINGVPCAENEWLLTKVLKEEWGFEGQVVSDWGAVWDQVKAFNAGNDMDMPGPRGKQKLYEAVENGTISMERLNDAVSRMLRLILKTPKFNGKRYTTIDAQLSQQAAYNAAAEGITLLKNEGILPLRDGTKTALFGRLTGHFIDSGTGSAQVDTSKTTNLPTEIARYTDTVLLEETDDETEVVLLTAGASGQEGSDRPNMRLDPEDEVMLREKIGLARCAGKKIILLLNVAGPVELQEYVDEVDALVCMFFPGMEGARAVADILFGRVSPSGKLPLTFPKSYRQTPTAINFPGEYGHVVYGEGIFVGYRYYDYKGLEPLYPFGHGLSYSAFSMKDVSVSVPKYRSDAEEPLKVRVIVKNEGDMEAKEVVQLYIADMESTLQKPDKELKKFVKVSLKPGEARMVELELMPEDFASYDTELHTWVVEPGRFEIMIGNSSRNILACTGIEVTGKDPYGCSSRSAIKFIESFEPAVLVCEEMFGEAFSREKLHHDVVYFGESPLRAYLDRNLKGFDKESEEWQEMMQELDRRLTDLQKEE